MLFSSIGALYGGFGTKRRAFANLNKKPNVARIATPPPRGRANVKTLKPCFVAYSGKALTRCPQKAKQDSDLTKPSKRIHGPSKLIASKQLTSQRAESASTKIFARAIVVSRRDLRSV